MKSTTNNKQKPNKIISNLNKKGMEYPLRIIIILLILAMLLIIFFVITGNFMGEGNSIIKSLVG